MSKPTIKPDDERDPHALQKRLASIETRLGQLAAKNTADSVAKELKLSRLHALYLEIQRKQDKEAAKKTEAYTRAGVMQWLRELDPTERARIIREAQQIDAKRSGLA